jgi:signal transduction histidine kinase/HAMP domain-containing protein
MGEGASPAGDRVRPASQSYRSVQWRIMVRQLPLLLLLFIALLYWLETHLRDALYSSHLESVRESGLMVTDVIQTAMRSAEEHKVWEEVGQRIPVAKGLSFTIMNTGGRVLFSTEPGERGRVHKLTDADCAACHEKGSERAVKQTAFIREPEGASYKVFAAPLRNTEDCKPCHANYGPKLGIVYVRQSLQPVQRIIRTTQVGIVFAGAVAFILTVLTTRMFLGRYLNRPLRKLVRGAREIGAGNLNQEISLPERSELSILADTLNSSQKRLREDIQEITDQRDDLKTFYHIAAELGRGVKGDERRRRGVEVASTIFKSDCLLIAGRFHPDTEAFDGTLTYRDASSSIVERPFTEAEEQAPVQFYSATIVNKWLGGELDGLPHFKDGSAVAYPLERHGRRLGLLLTPAHDESLSSDGRPSAANPEVVQAFRTHLAIALELSELQRERIRQERLAAIGETVAGLSHCLKNTLNGLRAGAYIVGSGMQKEEAETIGRGWKILRDGIRSIESLSLDLLYYAGEHIPQREPVSPNEIVEEVADLLRESAASQGVELRTELDQRVEKVRLDRVGIYRVILNLAANAVDACVESGTGKTITLRSTCGPEEVILAVEDNGIGMTEFTKRRIFERFFTTKSAKGTGLGLAVVKKIIDEHGGTIEVESVPGRGSTFSIRIPREPVTA